jgi:hypothetical protein
MSDVECVQAYSARNYLNLAANLADVGDMHALSIAQLYPEQIICGLGLV